MAKPKAPNKLRGGSVDELKKMIRDGVRDINAAKEDRSATNADIAATVELLESKGIGRHALKAAMAYASWDEDARAGFDVAYHLVRDAIGVPFQDQLFDADGNPNLVVKEKKKPGRPRKEAAGDDPKPEPEEDGGEELPLDEDEQEGPAESEGVKEPEEAPATAALH